MKISLGPKALALPSPVWLIGSYGINEQPNIMVAALASICCSTPPCIAISLKKSSATYANVMVHGAFTINIPSRNFLIESDYVGAVSGTLADKFSVTGLTAVMSDLVDAPYVQDFPLVLECRLLHCLEIGSHSQFIGQVMDVKAEEGVLGSNGLPVAEKVAPLLWNDAEQAYYALGDFLDRATFPAATMIETDQLLDGFDPEKEPWS